MKYNRQQKYNCWSFIKTILLVTLICVSMILSYSYLQIRQKNLSTLNNIELQKTQISDLEALSRANKDMIKNLKLNIENQKQNLKKLSESILKAKHVESDNALRDLKIKYRELQDKYKQLTEMANEQQRQDNNQYERGKDERATRIEELKQSINKLHDNIANLRKMEAGSINSAQEKIATQLLPNISIPLTLVNRVLPLNTTKLSETGSLRLQDRFGDNQNRPYKDFGDNKAGIA